MKKEQMKTVSLIEKWKPVLIAEGLGKIQNRHKLEVTAHLLENQAEDLIKSAGQGYLFEAAPANQSGAFPAATNLKGYDPVMISLVRRSVPKLIAFDICGVQPMTGPTGLIFALKSKYSSQGGTEALFNEANSAFSGTGTQAGTDPLPQADANTYKPGTGLTTAAGEALGDGVGAGFAEMAFSIDKVTVTAQTRALKAEYTTELATDLANVHGIDAETELVNILTNEILAEQNREIVRTIYNHASVGAAQTSTAGEYDLDLDSSGRWSVEKFKGLLFQIEKEANAIDKAVRRGRGNILITSADVASALNATGLLDTSLGGKGPEQLNIDDDNTYAGMLNGRIKVFIDPYAPISDNNYFVMGYKGVSAFDAGLFYCPYVPLQMFRAQGENSFQPKIAFKTRYGIVANPFTTGAWNSNTYYRKVLVKNLL